MSTDVATGETTVVIDDDLGDRTFVDHGLRVSQHGREEYTAHPSRADHYRAQISGNYSVRRRDSSGSRSPVVTG